MNDRCDVVVVGAGAAGLATAISLARQNAKVALLERRNSVGGIVTHALIHTIAGLYDANANHINAGLPVELDERLRRFDANTRQRKIGRVWVLNACPTVYARVVQSWLCEEANIRVFHNVSRVRATVTGDQVRSLVFLHQGKERTLHPEALIDCTGEASVIESIDTNLVLNDGSRALSGLILRIRKVRLDELRFPKSLVVQRKIQAAVHEGILPLECSNVWLDTGVYDDEIYLKLSISQNTPAEDSQEIQRLKAIERKLISFLTQLSPFADAVVVQTGELSLRGGPRAKGEYKLTVDDVRNLRKFPDPVCRCAWPIEYWNPDKGVDLEYLKGDGHYEIPKRALKVVGFRNLWTAGKCLSSDHLAQASARVSGCCWAMGEAVGKAALQGAP